MNAPAVLKPAAPLPRIPSEWVRKVKFDRTLNDQVEELHNMLMAADDNETYVRLLDAVYDEQAEEGSLSADNIMAAMKIRDLAKKLGNDYIAGQKLASISKALGVVLRRYGVSRKERRQMLDGEVVPGDNGD